MSRVNCVKFFFGRFQPPHSGHFDIIERTIANNSSKCKIFIFISPKTSRDDIARGTYGAYEAEDRYPLTASERREIIVKELQQRDIDGNVEVLTNARSAQAAIKEIVRLTGLDPDKIDIVLGEDERQPFSVSFYGKPRLDTPEDEASHPEKYVGMEIFGRSDGDVSATKIRNQLIELIIASDLDTENILDSINDDSFLSSVLPNNRDSRRIIIENYKKKIKHLGHTKPFGRFSALGLGRRRTKRRSTHSQTKYRRTKRRYPRKHRRNGRTNKRKNIRR